MNRIREVRDWIGEEVKIEFASVLGKEPVQAVTTLIGVGQFGIFVEGPEFEAEFYPFHRINIIMKGKK